MDDSSTSFDVNSEARAVELFSRDPEAAQRGNKLISVETDPEHDRSLAIANLASDSPTRFLELVSYLPHSIQDIFYQYYLLGRTQTQIAITLGTGQTKIWQALRLGARAMCAVIGKDAMPQGAEEAYHDLLAFARRLEKQEPLIIVEPKILGAFEIPLSNDDFECCFAPMSTDGPVKC